MKNTGRKSNYIEDQRLQEDKKVIKLWQMKQAIQWTNEPKEGYYDKVKKDALSHMWKLPKVCAEDKQFALKNKVHKHGIIASTRSLKACAKIKYECLKMQIERNEHS
jgi:hypothetical protein